MFNQERLIVMANQIGQFFASSQGPERGVVATAEHLRKFWEPRMRRAALALLEQGGSGLQPVPRQALQLLAAERIEAVTRPRDPVHAASDASDSAV